MSTEKLGLKTAETTPQVDLTTKDNAGFFDKVKQWGTKGAVMLAIGAATLTSCKKAVFDKVDPQIHDLVSTTVATPVVAGQELEDFYVSDNKSFDITVTGSSNVSVVEQEKNHYKVFAKADAPTGLDYTITAKDSRDNDVSQNATVTVSGSGGTNITVGTPIGFGTGGAIEAEEDIVGTIHNENELIVEIPVSAPSGIESVQKLGGDPDDLFEVSLNASKDKVIVKRKNGEHLNADPTAETITLQLKVEAEDGTTETINQNINEIDIPETTEDVDNIQETPTIYGATTIPGGRHLYKRKNRYTYEDGVTTNDPIDTLVLEEEFQFGTALENSSTVTAEMNDPSLYGHVTDFDNVQANIALQNLEADGQFPANVHALTLLDTPVSGVSVGDIYNTITNQVIFTKQEWTNHMEYIVHRMEEAGLVPGGFGIAAINGSVPSSAAYKAIKRWANFFATPNLNKTEIVGLGSAEQIP